MDIVPSVLIFCWSTSLLCNEYLNWMHTSITDEIDPSGYASKILYSVSKAKLHSNIEYTPREITDEMLNQALKETKYEKSAIKLLTKLSIFN